MVHAARRATLVEGPRLVALAALIAAVEVALTAAAADPQRALVRLTAQTSLAWFVPTFVASALVALAPGPTAKWLLRNRRYLGLGMAVSHGAHLGGIVALAVRDGHGFWATVASSSVIGGSLGYALIAAMVATSTDGARRRLGPRAWRALHATGMWALWLIFVGSYAGRLGRAPFAAVAMIALLGGLGLRLAAVMRRRAARAVRPAG
ncbi:MAG: ferric reductase-like transmembrane domain-containing protein [Myxococcales bacterium]|nr:ferric reductase-like transmembrane domain-containing protein [Myxococcales bacterium]